MFSSSRASSNRCALSSGIYSIPSPDASRCAGPPSVATFNNRLPLRTGWTKTGSPGYQESGSARMRIGYLPGVAPDARSASHLYVPSKLNTEKRGDGKTYNHEADGSYQEPLEVPEVLFRSQQRRSAYLLQTRKPVLRRLSAVQYLPERVQGCRLDLNPPVVIHLPVSWNEQEVV